MSRTYEPPARVQRNQQARAAARRPQPCGSGLSDGRTCRNSPAVLYPCGWRCATCAATAGLTPVDAHRETP